MLKNYIMNSKVNEKQSYVHPHNVPYRGKILMVASSPSVSEQTGWPIGFWAAELTHPLHMFQQAGYEVDLASTEGGKIEMDSFSSPLDESGYSAHDIITLGYMQKEWFNNLLENTKHILDVEQKNYDAIFLVGGQAPMYTFKNKDLEHLFVNFLRS